ncbi:MAG: hypothetical protein QM831_06845 [Kofleriaceae bacterium]
MACFYAIVGKRFTPEHEAKRAFGGEGLYPVRAAVNTGEFATRIGDVTVVVGNDDAIARAAVTASVEAKARAVYLVARTDDAIEIRLFQHGVVWWILSADRQGVRHSGNRALGWESCTDLPAVLERWKKIVDFDLNRRAFDAVVMTPTPPPKKTRTWELVVGDRTIARPKRAEIAAALAAIEPGIPVKVQRYVGGQSDVWMRAAHVGGELALEALDKDKQRYRSTSAIDAARAEWALADFVSSASRTTLVEWASY